MQLDREESIMVLRGAKIIFLFSLLFILSSCGGGDSDEGHIAISVKNALRPAALKSQQSLPEILTVDSFRVVVSADDMPSAISVSFPATTTQGQISGIPIGQNRSVLIEALNKDKTALRRRLIKGVEIHGGDPTPLQATLLTIPVITNIKDGGFIPASRLILSGYGEPAGSLAVMDHSTSGISASLSDFETKSPKISPSLSAGGFFSFHATSLVPGVHTFEVRDDQTGESSTVTVTILQSGRQPGTWLSAAGQVEANQIFNLGIAGSAGKQPIYTIPSVLNVFEKGKQP